MQQETMRGSLFPLLPLRVKRQNHERDDMGHQNRWNRDPLSVFPGWNAKTMRGPLFPLLPLRVKCQNHERDPISSISPYFGGQCLFILRDMDHQVLVKCVLGKDPLSVFPGWSAKTMRGSLFPLFWWPMSWQDDKTWTTKIGEIEEIGTLSWFWHFTLRGNRGNREPLSVFPGWSAKISPILVAHVLTRWQDMDQ